MDADKATRIVVERPLTTARIYFRALLRAPGRRQGEMKGAEPGEIEIVQSSVRLDARKVSLFREVCGCRGECVPAAYPEALFLGLMAEGVLSPGFPFSPFGLIHIEQRIEQHRPLSLDDSLDLSCRLAGIRPTERGYEVDFAMVVTCGGRAAWEGVATLLTRNAATRARKGGSGRKDEDTGDEGYSVEVVEVPGDTGRRYAAASDDYNPHHLYPITARLFGYSRPIAHGMWTLARALSAIGAPDGPVSIHASFKRPLLMPAAVKIRHRRKGEAVEFDVRGAGKGTLHLIGGLGPPHSQ